MSCEHLMCASCAGPVVEARCPVCRAGRAEVHHHAMSLPTPVLAALLAAVLLLAWVGWHLGS